ncbi:cyanidin 3-O-galactoside 2''-O-xylosyltransferase FGGT1-like [Vigna umbellata]|uniref:cyanidin 3-O-galactoside 2''-O-xylosyltransferase FGGT1-like n=1 Tax=Vigna umbellata TaxID=87088 RepID=UPI001F5EBAD0|nr:cyanidin 3-O-galactoside 2''-O-xylosyltransferase FGGT1-like [Vigna umbellata]
MACSPSLHITMLPWFAQEHITPFLQLSNSLAERGHKISFFIPKHTHASFQHFNHHPNLISLIPICVPQNHHHGLPHVAEEIASKVHSSTVSLSMTPMLLCEKDIEVHLLELKPNIVFFDHAYWVPKPRLTQCLKIKSLVYHVISFSSLTCESSYSYPLGISKGYCCNIAEHHNLLHEPKLLAGSGKVDHGKCIVHTEPCTNSILAQSYATGLKGCTVIEGAYADCHRRHVTVPKEATCLIDENWAKWLGNYEAGSVVYCSFGSECTLEPCQFQEVVLGLELSGMPFVAALRPPKGFECVESALPKGFKERVQGRGVVSSAYFPHRFILEHPSVGCFVTLSGHSGSLSGALVNKCQLVLLPNHGEMVFSAGVIGTTLKVGVEVEKLTTKRVSLLKRVFAKL